MSHPVHVAGYDHIVLRVTNKDAAVAFYRDVLNCQVDWDRPELGLTHIRAGDQLIDLVTLKDDEPPRQAARNLDHFALKVRPFDVDAIRAHLAAHGVAVDSEGERYGAEGQGYSLYIRDPDGNTVELKGPSA